MGKWLVWVLFVSLGGTNFSEEIEKNASTRLKRDFDTRRPALCPLQQYGTSCDKWCRSDCPGKLCSSDGKCYYDNCHATWSKSRIDGCACKWNAHYQDFECSFASEAVRNLQLTSNASRRTLTTTFSSASGHPEVIEVDWIMWREGKERRGTLTFQKNRSIHGDEIPLTHDHSYIVCAAVVQKNFHGNPACIYWESPCASPVKTLKFSDGVSGKELTVERNDNIRGGHGPFVLEMTGGNWLCEGNVPFSPTSLDGLLSIDLSIFKGKWTACLREQHAPKGCEGSKKCTSEQYLGGVSVKVENLTATPSEKSVTLKWKNPDDWFFCDIKFFVSWKIHRGVQESREISNSVCNRSFHCVYQTGNVLQPGTEYTFEVVVHFENTGRKRSSSVTTQTLLSCPPKVKNIRMEEATTAVKVTWDDPSNSLNYSVTKKNNTACRMANVGAEESFSLQKREAVFQNWDPYASIEICIQPPSPKRCKNEECKTFGPQKKISPSVEDLRFIATESSEELHWTIPEDWILRCELRKFSIKTEPIKYSHVTGRLPPINELCKERRCIHKLKYYTPAGEDMSFQVVATFENNIKSDPASISGSPLPKDSDDLYKVLSKNPGNEDIFITYDFKGSSNKQVTSCSITAKNPDAETKTFDCSDLKGEIKNSELKSGTAYNVTFKICIEKWCTQSTEALKVWTPPEKPPIGGSIELLFSNNTHVQLKLPSTGEYSDGSIFLFVAKEKVSFDEKTLEQYLPTENNHSQRSKRNSLVPIGETNLFREILQLKTKEYTLLKSSLVKEGEGEVTEAFLCCLFQFKSGDYERYSSTDFQGPFVFEELSGSGRLIGISLASFLGFFLLVIFIFSMLYFIRHSSKNDEKSQLVRDSPPIVPMKNRNGRDSALKEHENQSTSETSTVALTPATLPTASAPQDRASNCPVLRVDCSIDGGLGDEQRASGSGRLGRPTLAFPCDPLTPTPEDNGKAFDVDCDYSNIEPELSFWEGLERYLIRVAYSEWIENEFKSIPMMNHDKSTKEGKKAENRKKNRYQNNLPYDDSRVSLPLIEENDLCSDYINASWIKIGVGKARTPSWYIATQGPLKRSDTISDFWRMVWYNDVEVVVMVTNLVENGKAKCDQYWPDEGETIELKDEILVKGTKIEFNTLFLVRRFVLCRGHNVKQVIQYNYTEWPDHGTPLEVSPLVHLINRLRARRTLSPVVIHCSAGIGRTGVLLLVIMCLEEIENFQSVSISGCLRTIRNYRPKLVQNTQQYIFAHYLLWSLLFNCEETYPTNDFEVRLRNELFTLDENNPKSSVLADQFKRFKNYSRDLTFVKAMHPKVRDMNRSVVFPADVKLVTFVSLEECAEDQYLNAIRVDGFNRKDAYIVTEHPTMMTLGKVWFMILERQLPVWILLNEMDSSGDKEYPPLLPVKNKDISFDYMTISLLEKCKHRYYTESRINIQANYQDTTDFFRSPNGNLLYRKGANREMLGQYLRLYSANGARQIIVMCDQILNFECRVIQFRNWIYPEISPRTGAEGLFTLLNHLRESVHHASPMLFTCADGYTACGAALGLDIAWKRADEFQEVQIFSTCVGLTYTRPEFIVSVEQYRMLHEYLNTFLILKTTK